MLNLTSLLPSLKTRLDKYISQPVSDGKQFLSIVITMDKSIDPLLLLYGHHCFWSCPKENAWKVGLGVRSRYQTSGENRINAMQDKTNKLMQQWKIEGEGDGNAVLFIALAIDPQSDMTCPWEGFSNTELIVPIITFERREKGHYATFNFRLSEQAALNEQFNEIEEILNKFANAKALDSTIENFSDQADRTSEVSLPSWRNLYDKAMQSIQQGGHRKIVLSRQIKLHPKQPPQPLKLLRELHNNQPLCQLISFYPPEAKGHLIAASPETLLHTKGKDFSCDALGGTFPAGSFLPKALDKKLRHEHDIIVKDLVARSAPLSFNITSEETAVQLRFNHLQHFLTKVQGRLNTEHDCFDMLSAIYPNAALSGHPANSAHDWLKINEPFNRGLYTGLFGWIDSNGDSHFTVVLRCALLYANVIFLYAGAGLTEDSNFEIEWQEIELKFKTLLDLF